jgi:hypothetical protein
MHGATIKMNTDKFIFTFSPVGRSPDRYPVVSLGIFFKGIRQVHVPGVDFRNEYQHIPGDKDGRCGGLTTFTTLMCRLSRNPGALTSRTPEGHVGLFRAYFTFYLLNVGIRLARNFWRSSSNFSLPKSSWNWELGIKEHIMRLKLVGVPIILWLCCHSPLAELQRRDVTSAYHV